MHLKRWLTAIIAVPVLIYLIGTGQRWPFHAFLFIACAVGLSEFYNMTGPVLPGFVRWAGYFLTFLLFLAIGMKQVLLVPLVIVLYAFVPMTYYLLTRSPDDRQWTTDLGRAVFGPVYTGLPLAMMIIIDMRPQGKIWIFFLLAVIFATDTAAFYFGRLFGKHKLYETVSPNKTWEGAVGGLVGSLIIGTLFITLFPVHRLNLNILLLVIALSVSSQIGDLAESMLKRSHGIKDSGKILPGHGGVLDRIDGLLFSIPVLYAYLVLSI